MYFNICLLPRKTKPFHYLHPSLELLPLHLRQIEMIEKLIWQQILLS